MPYRKNWVRHDDDSWTYHGEEPPYRDTTPLQEMVIRWLAISLIVVLPLGAAFLLNRSQTQGRISDNRQTINREAQLRMQSDRKIRALTVHFDRVQQWQQFDGCVADEQRDAVIVSLLRMIPRSGRPVSVQAAIDALEPSDGTDTICIPPSGARPREVPRP